MTVPLPDPDETGDNGNRYPTIVIVMGIVFIIIALGVVGALIFLGKDTGPFERIFPTLFTGLTGIIVLARTERVRQLVRTVRKDVASVKEQTNGALSELVSRVDPKGETDAAGIIEKEGP